MQLKRHTENDESFDLENQENLPNFYLPISYFFYIAQYGKVLIHQLANILLH